MREPSTRISANFPLDFYHTYGTDLATTVIPTQDNLIGDTLPLAGRTVGSRQTSTVTGRTSRARSSVA